MKAIYYILLPAAMLFAMSCEKEHALRNLPSKPLLFVECISGIDNNEDNTEITATATTPELKCHPLATSGLTLEAGLAKPAGALNGAVPDIETSSISISINDSNIPLTVSSTSSTFDSFSKKMIYESTTVPQPGDRLSMEMSLDGVKAVSAGTVIPEPITEIRAVLEDRNGNLLATISIPDDPGADEFFAVEMFLKKMSTKIETGVQNPPYIITIQMDFPDTEDYPDLVNSGTLMTDDNTFFVFGDGGGRDGWRTVHLQGKHTQNKEVSGYKDEYFYQIVCYRLSPEYFYYFRARHVAENNILGQVGFAPGIFAYTNISGGLGVMGAAAASATGWIPDSEVKLN